ncbi:amino acid adenylation domain-containing protein [Acidobacteriota bacterium]
MLNRDVDSIAASKKTREREYWLNKLSGELVRTGFPRDNLDTDSSKTSRSFKRVKFQLTDELSSVLVKVSKDSDYRLFMVLVAGMAALLQKYTGHQDIIFGAPAVRQELDAPFINTVLILRNLVEDNLGFKELLFKVRETMVEAAENQNYPLSTLLYDLDIQYSDFDKEFPLFSTALLLENIHDKRYLDHISLDLVISFSRIGRQIRGEIEYNELFYRPQTIERIAVHLQHLLQAGFSEPGKPLSCLDIISETEKKLLLYDLNDLHIEPPGHKILPRLIEEWAEKNPDRIAVSGKTRGADISITYGGLNKEAGQLACLLQQKGVRPDTIVALKAERTIEMIIAIVGILKSGAAYLPISLKYPEKRVDYILKDSSAVLLVTVPGLQVTVLSTFTSGTVNRFNSHQHGPAKLAYVIYTSGSTGNPKGIMIGHRQVQNLVFGLKETIYKHYPGYLHVCLIALYEFDASVQQIFGALLQGHHLRIVPEETRVNGRELVRFYQEYNIDISDGTPSHIRLLVEEIEGMKEGPIKLEVKHFIIAGEAFPVGFAARFFKCLRSPVPQVSNIYGPTETCVDSTFYHIPPGKVEDFASIPIGRGLPNQQVYILGKNYWLLPMGVPGELCIGGYGVARGYLNNPELTAEKFIDKALGSLLLALRRTERARNALRSGNQPGTFQEIPGARNQELRAKLYKTGDLARWLPEGSLEFLGRMDRQVKLRGYRVELKEIETRLAEYENVKEALVMIRSESSGDEYICAYLVPAAGAGAEAVDADTGDSAAKFDLDEIREYLSRFLPDFMIPSYFVPINRIPLTSNGKIDEKALRLPRIIRGGTNYVPPRDVVETKLVEIWSEIMGIEEGKFGIHDNLFDWGGHSLKFTLLVSRIYRELNVKISLLEIFKNPTIRELARKVKMLSKVEYIPVEPVEEKEVYPVSSAQKRLLIVQQMDPLSTSYNMPQIYVMEGDLEVGRLEEVFLKMKRRHESLRTSFAIIGEEAVQRVHEEVDFEVEYFEGHQFHPDRRWLDLFIRPFDLSGAPLFRVGLAMLGQKKHLLMVDMHHIVSDGVSQEILRKDFALLYKGEELPALKLRYRDFSGWQNNLFKTGEIAKQEKYWLEQFSGQIPVLNLPADYPRPPGFNPEGNYISMEVGKEIVDGIKQVAKETNATLFMVLLAAGYVLLARYSGQEDIIVGSPVIGRRHVDLENIIGMFVSTLALRNYPRSEKTFKKFLEEVKENSLKAFENQDYPFDELVEKLEVKREANRNPLFNVEFNFSILDPVVQEDNEIPGLKFEPFDFEVLATQFDLSLDVLVGEDKITVGLGYSTKLFKKETMERMLRDYIRVIETAAANVNIKIGGMEFEVINQLSLVNEEEEEEEEEVAFNF